MGKMGKKFVSAIRKIFSPKSKEKKGEKSSEWGCWKSKHWKPWMSEKLQNTAPVAVSGVSQPVHPWPHTEEIKLAEEERGQSGNVCSVGVAGTVQTTEEVVRLSSSANFTGDSREVAAIKIQTAFRGYQARRALRALKGLIRLKTLINGNGAKRQAEMTLRCMQMLAKIQSQIRSRRIRLIEGNQTLQRQLLLKQERELEKMHISEEWDDSMQSKEQIEASLLSKQEALMRRERALAYAFSHQWKSPSRQGNPNFMDGNNPQWGWSWLELWMTASHRSAIVGVDKAEISKACSFRHTPERSTQPPNQQSPATPSKIKTASPTSGWHPSDDGTKSLTSLQSERRRRRRRSLAGSSDESLTSSMTVLPSYMAQTESSREKSWFHGSLSDVKIESTDGKDSWNKVKKRLCLPPSPAVVKG
ncbi:protein IQ-DOMAIN 1-like [Phalaenopsis equestris]|uniref:protein IQ-DOMAIN 1-like n=1 Tax=Phalaenopsis equestris TaxID=78828 RepID=UPI0009E5F239|nr:protein IQ-DOMAIN 1-like [Phalaenopsis equestris]XP_020578183.1 protein IQ-DOMAIN 1-like [Phalaenopsis equestris]